MSPARLVVCASGGGRTLENLQRQIEAGHLPAHIALVIVSHTNAGALQRARRMGLVTLVIGPRSHPDVELRQKLLIASILEARADLVVLAGWLQLLPVPPELEGRVVNVHPALLPAYGGSGFYGDRVHRAVVADRPPLSGCTVHFADARYDRGPVILQEAVPVLPEDDAEALAARVFAAEKRALPEALRLVIEGRAQWRADGVVWA